MKRSLKVLASGRTSLMIGLVLLGASLHGCGPTESVTVTPSSTGSSAPSAVTTAKTGPAPKGVDTTSRRAHQKQQTSDAKKTP
jgi:hypothetical protein